MSKVCLITGGALRRQTHGEATIAIGTEYAELELVRTAQSASLTQKLKRNDIRPRVTCRR